MNALVSAIIPTYNRAASVCRAIESVLQQSYTPVEVLVCDDGSTDATIETIQRRFAEQPRVQVLALPHSGLPAVARNAGLRAAQGEWIAFLDSDDQWHSDRLEIQVAVLQVPPEVGLVCSNARLEGLPHNYFSHPPRVGRGGLADLLRDNFIIASSVLVRRELLARVGGFCEDQRLRAVEDYDLWLRVAASAGVRYVDAPLVSYHDDPEQSLRGEISRGQYREGLALIYHTIEEWTRQRNVLTAEAKGCLRLARWDNDWARCQAALASGDWWAVLKTGARLPYSRVRCLLARSPPPSERAQVGDTNATAGGTGNAGLRLHLGCGQVYLPGYLNIDYPPGEHSVQQESKADLHADILQLDYPAHSIQEVRAHHVFEHFQRPVALALLVRWYQWLAPGGILRLETPDLERSIHEILGTRDERQRQRILRHVFGSHEAHWATHHDGWYKDKWEVTLGRLGFHACQFEYSSWKDTFNVTVTATKDPPLRSVEDQRAGAEQILRDSLIDDSPSERRLLVVWLDSFDKQLAPRT